MVKLNKFQSNSSNPTLILPYYRGENQSVQYLSSYFFPCHRGNTKGSKNNGSQYSFKLWTDIK